MKEQYDKHVQDAVPYVKEQLVWLSAKNINTDHSSTKFEHQHFGPFKVVQKIGASAYKLDISTPWRQKKLYNVFNESLLCPYVAPFFPSQVIAPPDPSTLIAGEEHYDIEAVLNTHLCTYNKTKVLQFFVKWLDYGNEENSWVSMRNLTRSCKPALEAFYAKYKRKPGHNTWREEFNKLPTKDEAVNKDIQPNWRVMLQTSLSHVPFQVLSCIKFILDSV
jgi:hypothetical protein